MNAIKLKFIVCIILISACSHTKVKNITSLNSNDYISIVYTSKINGQLNDCGCSHDPKGGLMAREKHYNKLKEIIPNMLLVDSGGSVFEGNNFKYPPKNKDLDLKEANTLLNFHKKLNYRAQGLALEELKYDVSVIEDLLQKNKIQGIASNLILKRNSSIVDHIETTQNSKKIIFFSLVSSQENKALQISSPNKSIIKLINKYPADLYIVLNNLGYIETLKLLKTLSEVKTPTILLGSNSDNKSMLLQKRANSIWLDTASSYQSFGIINLKLNKTNTYERVIELPKEACKKGQSGYPELAEACYYNLETRVNL